MAAASTVVDGSDPPAPSVGAPLEVGSTLDDGVVVGLVDVHAGVGATASAPVAVTVGNGVPASARSACAVERRSMSTGVALLPAAFWSS